MPEPQPLAAALQPALPLRGGERELLLAQLAPEQIAAELPAALALLHPDEVPDLRARARLVTTNLSQSFDGFWLAEVRISTVSPFRSA